MGKLAALALFSVLALQAQYVPPGGGGGSTSLTVGSTPITSGTDGLPLLQTANKVSEDSTFHYYPNGIPDPTDAPPVTVHGTANGTSYGYVIVEWIGPRAYTGLNNSVVAATLPSPTTTVTGNSTLDSTNYNSITVPTVSDPNVACVIVRVAGPRSPQMIRTLSCDGSTWNDQSLGLVDGFALADLNTTAGISIFGGFISTGGVGISTFAAPALITPNEGGAPAGYFYQLSKNGTWAMFNGSSPALQDIWVAGWATALTSVSNTNTPYQITVSDGTIKCDATASNVAVTLPDPSTDPEFQGNDAFVLGSFARYYTIHKVDSSANTCTVNASSGTTIDGSATYVLTQPSESVTVYWDGASWPTSNRLDFSKVLGVPAGVTKSCSTAITAMTVVKGIITSLTCP